MKNNKIISIVLSSLLLTTSLYSEEKKGSDKEQLWKKSSEQEKKKPDNLLEQFDTPFEKGKKEKAVEGEVSWSLVNEDCEPELDLDGAFDDMMDMYLKSAKKAMDVDVWKPYLFNNTLDGMVEYVAKSRCYSQLATQMANPINQSDQSAKMTECINKNTKGLVTDSMGTTTGTQMSGETETSIDYASLGATSTCVSTVYGKKQAELFNQCIVDEKKNILSFFNGRVKAGIDQANIDLKNQHDKCILDSQNYQNSLQEIIGNGWKTQTDGDKVNLLVTNAVDENIEDIGINRGKALHLSSEVSKSMIQHSSFTNYSNTDVLGYSIILDNWSERVFESGCNTINVETDRVNATVLDCRWDDRTMATLTLNEVEGMSESNKVKVTVMEECKDMTKQNPLFTNEPDIVMLENGKNPQNDFVSGANNRFDYFLKVDKGWNSKNLTLGDGSQFNPKTTKINKIKKLTKSAEYAMRTICRDWAIDYRDSINAQILEISTKNGSNQAIGGENGKGISEKTDKLRNIMETQQDKKIKAKLKMTDDLVRELELRLSETDKNEMIHQFGINID